MHSQGEAVRARDQAGIFAAASSVGAERDKSTCVKVTGTRVVIFQMCRDSSLDESGSSVDEGERLCFRCALQKGSEPSGPNLDEKGLWDLKRLVPNHSKSLPSRG